MPRFAQSHLRALRIVVPIKSSVRGEVRCLPTAQLLPIISTKISNGDIGVSRSKGS
jgi:hypothetical protein